MFSCSCEAQSKTCRCSERSSRRSFVVAPVYHQATHSTVLAVVSCHNKRAEMRTTSLASITLALRTGCNRGRPMPARDPPWGRGNARRKQASIAVIKCTRMAERHSAQPVRRRAGRQSCGADALEAWSGRRESNPRMQLGKLAVSQGLSELSCKTGRFSTQSRQRVTSQKQNPRAGLTLGARW